MPVWLTFFLSLLATVGFFVAFFGSIYMVVNRRMLGAAPKLHVGSGAKAGQLSVWMNWDSQEYAIRIYRILLTYYSPDTKVTEGRMSITLDPPVEKGFVQIINLNPEFTALMNRPEGDADALISVQCKSVEETTIESSLKLNKFKKLAQQQGAQAPSDLEKLEEGSADLPDVSTLDFAELEARKGKFKRFEDAVKARDAKKAAAEAAKKAAAAKAAEEKPQDKPADAKPPAPTPEAKAGSSN